jgi:hypothetical protein
LHGYLNYGDSALTNQFISIFTFVV